VAITPQTSLSYGKTRLGSLIVAVTTINDDEFSRAYNMKKALKIVCWILLLPLMLWYTLCKFIYKSETIDNNIKIALFLILFPPLGLYMMWKSDWSKNTKISVVAIYGLITIWCVLIEISENTLKHSPQAEPEDQTIATIENVNENTPVIVHDDTESVVSNEETPNDDEIPVVDNDEPEQNEPETVGDNESNHADEDIEVPSDDNSPEAIKNRLRDNYDLSFRGNVNNDVTGNWRLANYNSSTSQENFAGDYYRAYFENDKEIHAVINWRNNTTASIKVLFSGVLDVSIHEYIENEEHDAKKLIGGTLLGEYWVHLDSDEIEKIQ